MILLQSDGVAQVDETCTSTTSSASTSRFVDHSNHQRKTKGVVAHPSFN